MKSLRSWALQFFCISIGIGSVWAGDPPPVSFTSTEIRAAQRMNSVDAAWPGALSPGVAETLFGEIHANQYVIMPNGDHFYRNAPLQKMLKPVSGLATVADYTLLTAAVENADYKHYKKLFEAQANPAVFASATMHAAFIRTWSNEVAVAGRSEKMQQAMNGVLAEHIESQPKAFQTFIMKDPVLKTRLEPAFKHLDAHNSGLLYQIDKGVKPLDSKSHPELILKPALDTAKLTGAISVRPLNNQPGVYVFTQGGSKIIFKTDAKIPPELSTTKLQELIDNKQVRIYSEQKPGVVRELPTDTIKHVIGKHK
jgi:hypothetical protein